MLNILAAVVNSCTTGFNGVETCTQSNVDSGGFFAIFAAFWILWFAFYIFMVVVQWKVFTKAGKPGWASLIPIYNTVIMLQIVGKPDWWVILFLVPFVNFVVAIIVVLELAKSFGKSTGFAILLLLVPIIGYPMLAFGDAKYVGPGGNGSAPQPPAPSLNPAGNVPPSSTTSNNKPSTPVS